MVTQPVRRRILVLLGLTLATTTLVGWGAMGPSFVSWTDESNTLRFAWEYPILSIGFGITVTALLSFKRHSLRFIGSLLASAAGCFLTVRLLLTAVPSLMGHEVLFLVIMAWTIGLFIYTGYTLAIWRATRKQGIES